MKNSAGVNGAYKMLGKGWSEPAATNAPVEDEPVQPVLRMNILPAQGVFFFHLFSAPPTSPLLPTTYEPHPPSLHHQSSSCGARAVGVEAGPMRPRDPRAHFFKVRCLPFCFVFCVCFI